MTKLWKQQKSVIGGSIAHCRLLTIADGEKRMSEATEASFGRRKEKVCIIRWVSKHMRFARGCIGLGKLDGYGYESVSVLFPTRALLSR